MKHSFPIVAAVVVLLSLSAGAENYLVVDLSGGPDAAKYQVRRSASGPNLANDKCRTTELWLREIPAGRFTMGCDAGEKGATGYEDLPHEVTISKPFYMGVFETTQKQYLLVTGTNPSESLGDVRPVENVSWDALRGAKKGGAYPRDNEVDAGSFFGKLRARTGLRFDLPTEAQWEYACRAGTATALNSGRNLESETADPGMAVLGRYFWNQADGMGGSSQGHAKVGSYAPNAWGLYDMHGNVWEWCLDWYCNTHPGCMEFIDQVERLVSAPVVDPKGPAVGGPTRVLRGGSCSNDALHCRSSYRILSWSANAVANGGFRICCSAER